DLESKTFLDKPFPYFGGQQANRIFAESARNVSTAWSYLPFQVHANSIFNDTVGKAYTSRARLADGLDAWKDACADYGNDQGFTVNR
ncbi:sugar ABC transporter substrate-binding protein, partial [Streptomyces sp. NPDC056049]